MGKEKAYLALHFKDPQVISFTINELMRFKGNIIISHVHINCYCRQQFMDLNRTFCRHILWRKKGFNMLSASLLYVLVPTPFS